MSVAEALSFLIGSAQPKPQSLRSKSGSLAKFTAIRLASSAPSLKDPSWIKKGPDNYAMPGQGCLTSLGKQMSATKTYVL
jgi:hypothetical protein